MQFLGAISNRLQQLVDRWTPKWIKKFTALDAVGRLSVLERRAAVFVGASPILMVAADRIGQQASVPRPCPVDDPDCQSFGFFRGSISSYYEMIHYEWFFVPLMIAALLFMMNGLLRKGHLWNVFIGLSLMGVLLFDKHDRTALPHFIFAALLFVGNVAVFLFAHWRRVKLNPTRDPAASVWRTREMKVRLVLALCILLAVAADFLGWITRFWAEWASLVAVSIHFYRDESIHDADLGDPVDARLMA